MIFQNHMRGSTVRLLSRKVIMGPKIRCTVYKTVKKIEKSNLLLSITEVKSVCSGVSTDGDNFCACPTQRNREGDGDEFRPIGTLLYLL
jgi:hypothetical protein